MKVTITAQIIKVLKKAASIKDNIEPICNNNLRYYGKKRGYLMCVKCYPNRPERSKREDKCVRDIDERHSCSWHSVCREMNHSCDINRIPLMRCSEHCGNTVREVQ